MNAHDPSIARARPANQEAEAALLGAIMIDARAYDAAASILEPEHFDSGLHQRIFEVAGKMVKAGQKPNPITMKGHLPETIEGLEMPVVAYLARLMTEAVGIDLAKDFAIAIHEMWIRRRAIAEAERVVSVAYELAADADVLAELEPIEEAIAKLRAERIKADNRIGMGAEYLAEMSAAKGRGSIRGVPICLSEIADVISEPCFEAGNLYGLLSSSGEGKTSLTLQIIGHALKYGHPVQFLSYDQSRIQCVRQMVAQEHGIEARRQRDAKLLSEGEWDSAVDFALWIDRQPFEVVKCTDQGAAQLVGFARTFVKRHSNGKVPLIVVDHIGSVKPEDKRADEGTKAKDINKLFKAGAEMTDAAWLVLNQRNSFGMRRDNPRPISVDLFGGDPAKQAYDAILYLYRQEKFKAEREATAASDADWKKIHKVFGSDVAGVAEIGAIKVRFGNANIRQTLRFEDRFTRYVSERPVDNQEGLGI